MTSAMSFAHQHAKTCNQVESCAPEVTAPYLQAAYDRMKLPISVRMDDWQQRGTHYRFDVEALDLSPFSDTAIVRTVTLDPRDAARAYFDLCATLSQSASRQAHAGTPGAVASPSDAPAASFSASTILSPGGAA